MTGTIRSRCGTKLLAAAYSYLLVLAGPRFDGQRLSRNCYRHVIRWLHFVNFRPVRKCNLNCMFMQFLMIGSACFNLPLAVINAV